MLQGVIGAAFPLDVAIMRQSVLIQVATIEVTVPLGDQKGTR